MGNVVTSNQVFSNSNGEYYSFTRTYAQSTGLSNSATVTYSDAPTDTGYTYSMSESNSGTTSSGTGLTLSTSANFSIGQSSSQSITRDYNLTQSMVRAVEHVALERFNLQQRQLHRRLHRQWHPERLGSVGNVGLRHPKFHRLLHPQRLEQHHRQQLLHDGLVLLQPARPG